MNRLAIFVSGSGTNMENLIKEIQAGRIPAVAELVISDSPEAKAIQKAENLGVTVRVVERKKFKIKQEFEDEIIWYLKQHKIDYIALAGFMKILSPEFVKLYWGKIINIHPSLLPAFPGGHAIRDAFEAKAKETGVTVHFVDTGVDTGPVILQKKLSVASDESLDSLETKIHHIEYEIYPEALRRVFMGQIKTPEKES
ncbi:MAG: phosphoribosylglycinamide formyltransferase [Candidatus Omnitrophica bacterium]|nr:phosphoribosylglycinamide formyltransferase [Candidatus Omnitrophota bacterium]